MTNEQRKEVYLTQVGYEQTMEELNILKKEQRPAIIKLIKEARELGDLSENADYHAAREEQAVLEARISKLEAMIENAVIIKEEQTDKVKLGSTVKIKYVEDGEFDEYKIVGSQEADPSSNKVSNESPIGKALIGLKQGDTVSVASPNGEYKVEIIEIA